MWNRGKNTGSTGRIRLLGSLKSISVIISLPGALRRRSKTSGVMITQYASNLPEGKSTPDFKSKPTPITIDEGKLAVFKVVVNGDPKPEVSWKRAKGNILDKQKFQSKYNELTGEHILEIHKVTGEESDTYKCHAVNEYGKAVCTTTLTVIEASTNPADFRKLLRKSKVDRADGESDEKFWDAMLNADRKDYERICSEFGVTDLHSILKKLEEKKKERAQNKCKDGVIPYDEDEIQKHDLRGVGRTKNFSIKGQMQNDTGLYQGDVEEINLRNAGLNQVDAEEFNILSEEFKFSNVDFVIKIQETKAREREDALFECVLTHPLPKITWLGKGSTLEDGEKYSITVSDHKLIHRLLIRDCQPLDKGIYSAVTGITSCSAWLVVEAESNLAGKKIARKTALAGGARIDLEKVAKEQQIKYRQEMEKILASVKAKHEGGQLKEKMALTTAGGDGKKSEITEPDKNAGAIKDKSDAAKASAQAVGRKGKTKSKSSEGDGTVSKLDISGCVTKADVQMRVDDPKNKKHTKSGPVDFDKVTDANEDSEDNDAFTGPAANARRKSKKSENGVIESSEEYDDEDELYMSTNSPHEVATSNGNKSSSGSVRQQKKTKKVHWKEQTSANGNHLLGDFVSKNSALQDCSELTENPQCKAACVSPPFCGSNTNPNELEQNNEPSETEEEDDSNGQVKHLKGSKHGQKPKDAISGKRYPNELGKNKEPSESDEDEDSTGQVKHLKGSKQGQKPKDAISGKRHPKELESDKVPCENDKDKDSTVQVKHLKGSKHGQKPKDAVSGKRHPNELGKNKQPSESESDEDEDSTGQVKHLNGSKQGPKPKDAVSGKRHPKELESDNVPSESHNEPYENDEDEDSTVQLKHLKGSKQGQRPKNAVSGKRQSDNEPSESDEDGDSPGQVKHLKRSKKGKKPKEAVNGESTCPKDDSTCDETEDVTGSSTHTKRKRQGPLIEDLVIDLGVQFIWGLSDVSAIINETAELSCKLSSEDCEGVWFRDNKKISPDDNFSITKDGPIHKLVIIKCQDEHSGKYRFEADGRKTEAMINVKDPPRFHPDDLSDFTEPVIIKVGHNAIFKLHFVGFKPIKIKWYREGEELHDDTNTKIEKSESHSRLLLSRCQRKDTGEIKIKLKNEHGFTEAVSQLIVLDKPTPPLGPAEVTESSAACIEFRWRPPKDDGGSPVINYMMERQQVGRNTWKKIGEIPGVPCYHDIDVDRGRKYCYRIRAVTAEGTSEVMETEEMQAGTLAFPGPPAPPTVVSAFDDCINLSWASPSNTGGSRILGYILEKRKKGSNLWTVVNATDELIKEKKYGVKDVVEGMEYEFRVTAINLSGPGESSNPSEFVFARDPKKPPGKVTGLKVIETSYTHFVLTWTKPEEKPGIQDEARGYFVEIRQADCMEWSRCNSTPFIMTSFSVKGLKSMDMYWVRVIATNDGGESVPEELSNYVLAMPLPVRPKFTNNKMKTFMVVRAGNSVRITVNFEASPQPYIMWLKDNVPVAKRVTISNSDGSSQLLIPSSERSDSGIYSILVKNLVGQETFSTEVRVTDDPKPPGPVELEENVPGTVTVTWEPSPDEKRDDRLHYTVSKLDSTKRTWATVADRLFNNKFTVCNIMHGREYHFRVYAKNDMGISAPSESPTWGMEKKKEKFVVNVPTRRDCDLRCAPTFIVPLKLHTAPKGYECYMSCAVKGNPTPRITWYRNHISLNTNTNYYISNTCGVCSMLILRVGPKDMGEYMITAENSLGRAECSTVLSVRE